MRFTVNRSDLPGTPDIVLSRARLAVFVDGCFWHMCPDHHTIPKNNREWWLRKLEATVERDHRKDMALADLGWTSIHFWEHEDTVAVADLVENAWRGNTCR
jgi:DNA mismatch endonuclease, patch repair protein